MSNWSERVNTILDNNKWVVYQEVTLPSTINDVDKVSTDIGDAILQYQKQYPEEGYSMEHIVWENGVILNELGDGGCKYLITNNKIFTSSCTEITVEAKALITDVVKILKENRNV